ncbi:hypothetical protein Tco_0071514 [Tanacetum coccineum]
MPFKNKTTIDYSNTSNFNFLELFFLLYPESDVGAEDGSSVAKLGGVKSCTVIVVIYDFRVTDGKVRRTQEIMRRTCPVKDDKEDLELIRMKFKDRSIVVYNVNFGEEDEERKM